MGQRCASSSSENMKAQAVLCLMLLIGLASSHSLSKRSLLKGSSHGHGLHQHHHQRRFQGRRQHQRQSATGSRRTGRDGDHHDHDDSHGEVRAISTGYLPAQGLTICQDILDLRITQTSPSMDQTRVSTEPPSETVSQSMKRPLPQLQAWPEMLMARVRMTSTELPVTSTTAMLLLTESTGLQTVTVRVLELMSLV